MARQTPRGNGPEAFARRLVSLSFLPPRNAASLSSALILLSFASSIEASRGRQSPSSWFSESWDPLPVDIDPNSNRERQVEQNAGRTETTEYTYDFVNRLKTVTYPDRTTRYEYDLAGNRIQEVTTGAEASDETFHYDAINRLERITDNLGDEDVVYAYDANGNTTSKTKGGVTTNFFFDIRDQLGEVRQGGNILGRYGYDYNGRRILKIGDDGRRQYTYDQLSVITEADQVNNTVSKYDYGMDQLVRLDNRGEGRSFFHLDGLRSTVSLTDSVGGSRQSIFYDAWGNERDRVGSSANNFTFTGHELDEETGLIYAKARFYDSDVGRFLNQDDVLGETDSPPSLHRFTYAFNNPLLFLDPSGFFAQQLVELAKKERERQASVQATKEIVGVGLAGDLVAVDPDAPPPVIERPPQHMRSLEEQKKLAAAALENPDASATTVTEDDGLLSTGIPALDAELKRREDFRKARQTIGKTGTAVMETALPLVAGTVDDATVLLSGKDLNEKESNRLVAGMGMFLPFVSGAELRLLRKGGDELLESARPLLKQPPHRVVNALTDFQPRKLQFGDRTFLLDKRGMKHILERHHPEYWNGTLRSQQTFLDPSLEVDEVADIAEEVLNQNRSRLIELGNVGAYPVVGEVGGVTYQVGINNGRIAQMFPIPN